uniref:PDZ domain-containing protein n=1 Tax=Macrostomum lignano TaxID=282301 RepID=A0A1I8F7A6_9PLAT
MHHEVIGDEPADKETEATFAQTMAKDAARWVKADANADKKLDKAEFCRLHDVVVQEALNASDVNRDGRIDLASTCASSSRLREKEKREGKSCPGMNLDLNKDGSLDADDEVYKWIVPEDIDHSKRESKHLFEAADEDRDKFLSKDEVMKNWETFVGHRATHYGEFAPSSHDELYPSRPNPANESHGCSSSEASSPIIGWASAPKIRDRYYCARGLEAKAQAESNEKPIVGCPGALEEWGGGLRPRGCSSQKRHVAAAASPHSPAGPQPPTAAGIAQGTRKAAGEHSSAMDPQGYVVINLRRHSSDKSWGFAVQGGSDMGLPVFVHKITRNGIAHKSGLEPGDVIVKICQTWCADFSHGQVKAEILRAGNELDFHREKARGFNVAAYAAQTAPSEQQQQRQSEVSEEHVWRHGGPTFKNVVPKTYQILESQLPQSEAARLRNIHSFLLLIAAACGSAQLPLRL